MPVEKKHVLLMTVLGTVMICFLHIDDPHVVHNAVGQTLDLDLTAKSPEEAHTTAPSEKPPSKQCTNLLEAIQHGHWDALTPDKSKLAEVEHFLNETRTSIWGIPPTLQRSDGRCGNVTFDFYRAEVPEGQWQNRRGGMFRAVCNPHGDTPCCYGNQCVDRTPDQCACPDCIDIRRKLHANFARYILEDEACSLKTYSVEDTCQVMEDVEIQFVGDSLIDQLYLSTIILLKGGEQHIGVTDSSCLGPLLYYPLCRKEVPHTVRGCHDTVTVSMSYRGEAREGRHILNIVKSLIGKPRSVLVLGVGLHDDLNLTLITTHVLQPLIDLTVNTTWPKILFFTPMAPGLLKSPKFVNQNRDSVLYFNSAVKNLLTGPNMAVVDTFRMTDDVISYDGTHYGRALGEVKAALLVQMIERMKESGWREWS